MVIRVIDQSLKVLNFYDAPALVVVLNERVYLLIVVAVLDE